LSWWTWMIGGAILFGAELAFIDAQFYLVFAGSTSVTSLPSSPWRRASSAALRRPSRSDFEAL